MTPKSPLIFGVRPFFGFRISSQMAMAAKVLASGQGTNEDKAGERSDMNDPKAIRH
jgi:hypothetical protein